MSSVRLHGDEGGGGGWRPYCAAAYTNPAGGLGLQGGEGNPEGSQGLGSGKLPALFKVCEVLAVVLLWLSGKGGRVSAHAGQRVRGQGPVVDAGNNLQARLGQHDEVRTSWRPGGK